MNGRVRVGLLLISLVSLFLAYGGRHAQAASASHEEGLRYHTYDEMLNTIREFEKNHPDICQLHDLGVGSDGKTRMWAIKISDNVKNEEDEPTVLLTGGIHGNERPAPEMALFVIDELVGHRERHAHLIDHTQIWVIPIMNSAGHVLNSRHNANDIDLNRSFPADFANPSLEGKEPEIVNLIANFFRKHDHIVAGIDLHTHGGIYISPWARTRDQPADWPAICDLGERMAKASGYRFLPLHQFIGRTVQGGGADYRYGAHGTFYYGLELGRSHDPSERDLKDLCTKNLPGVLLMMNRVHHATLTGHVTRNGKPVRATVTVEGIDTPQAIRVPYRSDETFGRYYRLLVPGTYAVTFSLGDKPAIVRKNIEIVSDKQTVVDVDF